MDVKEPNSINKNKYILIYCFIAIEAILYLLFLSIDFLNFKIGDSTIYRYITVTITFLFSVIILFINKKENENIIDNILLSLALLFTLSADLFLLVIYKYFELGVLLFIIAHLFHFMRIILINKKILYSIILRILIPIIIIIILAISKLITSLNVLASIYFAQLIMNFIDNLILYIKLKNYKFLLLTIGFFLFICCDICVGLYNLKDIMGEFIWVFYTPSQVFIALSALNIKDTNLTNC